MFFFAGSPALAFGGSEDPWATPKGDARTNCAVYKTKNKHNDVLAEQAIKWPTSYSPIKEECILLKPKKSTICDGRSQMNLRKIEKREEEAYVELHLAQLNVVNHLGHSKPRLKEMLNYRMINGEKYKEVNRKEGHLRHFIFLREKRWDGTEISDFCSNL